MRFYHSSFYDIKIAYGYGENNNNQDNRECVIYIFKGNEQINSVEFLEATE